MSIAAAVRPAFAPETLELARDLLLRRAGLSFGDHNQTELEVGLHAAMAEHATSSAAAFLERAADPEPHNPAFESLIRAVTVGETYFFRHPEQFEVLRTQVLPELVRVRRATDDLTLRVWCAGCATGEEPYSVAMMLRDLLPDLESWRVHLLATDINRAALAHAERAEYGEWSFRGVTAAIRARHFEPAGAKLWRPLPEIRGMVGFRYLNLKDGCYPSLLTGTTAFDLILCRNVMIYFARPVLLSVVERLHDALVAGGALLAGITESDPRVFRRFSEREHGDVVVYLKREPAAAPKPPRRLRPAEPMAPPAPPPRAPVQAKGSDLDLRIAAGIDACGLGDYGRAAELFTRVILERPALSAPYFWLAKMAADRGEHAQADRWITEAVAREQMDPLLYHLEAIVSAERGEHGRGIAALRKALFLDPEFAMGHFRLALLYERAGKSDKAQRSLRNARRLLKRLEPAAVLSGVEEISAGFLLALVEKRLGA